MGNKIGVECSSSGLRIGCSLNNYTDDWEERFNSLLFKDPDFQCTEVRTQINNNPQNKNHLSEASKLLNNIVAKAIERVNETHGYKPVNYNNPDPYNKLILNSGSVEANKKSIQHGSEVTEQELVLFEFLTSLLKHQEAVCDVITINQRIPESPRKRFYLINLPKITSDHLIELSSPYLSGKTITVTGSGSQKFVSKLKSLEIFDAIIEEEREVNSILRAIQFLIDNCPHFIFSYETTIRALNEVVPDLANFYEVPLPQDERDNFYPFLLVNLKAGISFVKVTGPFESTRVGGSTIGGATFMGLIRLLINQEMSPEKAMILAMEGKNINCDMLVSDIYGGGYASVGLPGNLIASSFGKLQTTKFNSKHCSFEHDDLDNEQHDGDPFSSENNRPKDSDILRSLLTLMTFNVMQQAYLESQIHNVPRVVFTGFLLNIPSFLASIQHSINFWSKGRSKTYFFKMSPFLATLGALVKNQEIISETCVQNSQSTIPSDEYLNFDSKISTFFLSHQKLINLSSDPTEYLEHLSPTPQNPSSPNLSYIIPR